MDIVDRLKVLRSKNAGPYAVTLDVVFNDAADFEAMRQRLDAGLVAAAYGVDATDVLSLDFFAELLAAKVSVRRRRPAGHHGDPDCYGMNQEQPLARLLRQLDTKG